MSLPVNNKKEAGKSGKNQSNNNGGSKFIKTNSKTASGAKQKVRSTGANRGS